MVTVNGIAIREMSQFEASAVAVVHNKAFAPWISSLPPVCRQRNLTGEDIQALDGQVFVAVNGGEVAGYTHAKLDSGETWFVATDEHAGQSQIGVLPEYQLRGIGRALVEHTVAILGRSEPIWVSLGAYSDNHQANSFLSALGFLTGPLDEPCPGCIEPYHTDDDVLATFDLTSQLPSVAEIPRLIVREVREADAEELRGLFGLSRPSVFGPVPSLGNIQSWMSSSWAESILVAEFEGQVVGSMEFRPWGVLGITGILPAFRRRGIGSSLLVHTLKAMKSRGISHTLADTHRSDTAAIRLYEKIGFDTSRWRCGWVKRALL